MENEKNIVMEPQEKTIAKRGRPKSKVEQPKATATENYSEIIDKFMKENEEMRKKNDEILKENAELKTQMAQFLAIVSNQNAKPEKKEEEFVKIGCRSLSGECLRNKDESIIYNFSVGEEREVEVSDLKQIFKDGGGILNNKLLFEKGIFYFVDENEYQKWGIKKRNDLSWDAIRDIVTMSDTNEMIRKIRDMTKDKKDLAVTNCLKFSIARMIIDREKEPLRGWRYENRIALENYLGNKFDDLIANVGLYNFVRYIRG